VSRLGWLTPDEIPGETLKRWLCIPNTPALLAAVTGALLPLAYTESWEQYGNVTSEEAALAMSLMLEEFLAQESACMPILHEPILLFDQKAQNAAGGTFNSGAWQQRVLNSKQGDQDESVTLANNRFTLPIGRWWIKWESPAYLVSGHQSQLYNVTQGTIVKMGSSERSAAAGATVSRSHGSVLYDVPSPMQFVIQRRPPTSLWSNGAGLPTSFCAEIYTQVELYLTS